ncbi:MAG: hypothetical protein M1130_09305 [Actinobacteria bacterium]|nr:hypothetical protein [Actinomycetota bacterium]
MKYFIEKGPEKVLFHHDPDRTGDELDLIQERLLHQIMERSLDRRCTVAYGGLELDL